MRVFLALIGGFALLVALLFGGLWRRSGAKVQAPVVEATPAEADVPVERVDGARVETRAPRVGTPAQRRSRVVVEEVAVLHGEVVGAENNGDDEPEDLVVEADDGKQTFKARVTGRRFVLRVPPRVYSLTAHDADQVGRLVGVRAAPGVNRELVIQLATAATISGEVRGGSADRIGQLQLRAYRDGTTYEESSINVEPDGGFLLNELVAGARYDLVFAGRGVRELRVPGILAPTGDLVVSLPPQPVLQGAVGVPAGQACGGETVSIAGNTDGDTYSVEFPLATNCHFKSDVPAGAELLVSVSSEGAHYEARVSVPGEGEPDFLCLNPPCHMPLLSALDVRLQEHDCARSHRIAVWGGEDLRRHCTVAAGACRIDQLPPDRPLTVHASCGRCVMDTQPISLQPGENQLTLPCQRERSIHRQGIVRLTEP